MYMYLYPFKKKTNSEYLFICAMFDWSSSFLTHLGSSKSAS